MRIGLITSYYEEKYGGNEYYLAKFLAKKGHQVNIYASKYSIPRYGKIRKITETTNLKNVRVIRLSSIGIKKRGMNYLFGLKKQLNKDNLDAIHVQEWIMPLTFSCLSFKNLILTQRINKYPFVMKLYARLLGKRILKKAKAVTALTRESRNELARHTGMIKDEIALIPNGVDVELFMPSEPLFKKKKFTILFVGRLSKEKGAEYLIKACAKLNFDYSLLIIGDGKEKNILLDLIKKEKLASKVNFIDYVGHRYMPKAYSCADVLVVPSITEPFGFVTLEALSCGVPVIGTDVGGMRDIITEKVGMKVKPKDAEWLARAITKMKDDRFRSNIKKNCRQYVTDNYSWEKIADKYIDLYSRMIK